MKKYKLQQIPFGCGTEYRGAQNLEDGTSFPFTDGNRDYEEYKKWLAEGNTPEPADQGE